MISLMISDLGNRAPSLNSRKKLISVLGWKKSASHSLAHDGQGWWFNAHHKAITHKFNFHHQMRDFNQSHRAKARERKTIALWPMATPRALSPCTKLIVSRFCIFRRVSLWNRPTPTIVSRQQQQPWVHIRSRQLVIFDRRREWVSERKITTAYFHSRCIISAIGARSKKLHSHVMLYRKGSVIGQLDRSSVLDMQTPSPLIN